jgi:NDP-sugar pyrophosphorylase family protein
MPMTIKQAFVLGAGMGLRLRPLTEQMPKPLVPIFQKPLITFSLDHLRSIGIESFVINTHRLATQFEDRFSDGKYDGVSLKLLHEPDLLETGGGIKNAEPALRREPFIVYSGDILTDIDLEPLIAEHFARGNDVTLALRDTGLASGVALRDGRVIDISNRYGHPGTHDFANISVWNPDIFERIPPAQKISFVPVLGDWIGAGGKIGGVELNERKWFNIGSRDGYLEVHRTIAEGGWRPHYVTARDWPVRVAEDAIVEPGAQLSGFYSVGSGSRIGADAVVENSVVWSGAQIASRRQVRNCIVRAGKKAEGILCDVDL